MVTEQSALMLFYAMFDANVCEKTFLWRSLKIDVRNEYNHYLLSKNFKRRTPPAEYSFSYVIF